MDEIRKHQLSHLLETEPFSLFNIDGGSLSRFNQALTHSSFANEKKEQGIDSVDNERLEFLGDRVLNLVVADYLYRKKRNFSEGEMTKRMEFTKNIHLGAIVRQLVPKFEDYILLGRGTCLTTNIIAGAFEAFIGALYLCYPIEKTCTIVQQLLSEEIDQFDPHANYIGQLQEYSLENKMPLPQYVEVSRKGPDNNRTFEFLVTIPVGQGRGEGKSKTAAKQKAALEVLKKINRIEL